MRNLIILLGFSLLLATGASAETLGEAALAIRQDAVKILDRYSTPTPQWAESTALKDVEGISQAAQALYDGLDGNDADSVRVLQSELMVQARRAMTSSVMLSNSAQADIQALLPEAERIDDRLTGLRQRFGGKASMTQVALRDLPVEESSVETYSNYHELLIDVRAARERIQSLRVGRAYSGGLFTDGQPNNLDPLQLQRFINAAWDLERTLSTNSADIRRSQQAWERFHREYRIMDYPGSNFNVRQLERIMRRLERFYDSRI